MARLYALLARLLLPRSFLEEYGAELVQSVADRLARAHGSLRRSTLLARELGDLIATATRERWSMLVGAPGRRRRRGQESAADWRVRASMLDGSLGDGRLAARRLRRRPGHALLAVLTLALGVGGTAAVAGITHTLLVDPVPYTHASDVGVFWKKTDWTEAEFLHIRGRTPGFRDVALYRLRDMTTRAEDAPARLLRGVTASSELFDVLGAAPVLGRTFLPGEDVQSGVAVAVLSHGLWQELGGSVSVLGSRLVLDGDPVTVVGVMPRNFWFPDPSVRVWMTAALDPASMNWNSTLIGRVASGQDVRRMAGPLAQLIAMLDERFEYPEQWDKTIGAHITPIRDDLVGGMRPALLATLGGMALILLIACGNVAALMLGEVDARSTEFAVRLALGAGRRRLIRQVVIEAAFIAAAAGLLGALLAWSGFHILASSLPLGAWSATTTPDWTVFASALAIAAGASLLVVVVPGVSLWRGDLRATLGRVRTGGVEGRGGRLENGLVVAEVTFAVLIACGASLLARSVTKLYALEPGVRTEGVLVLDVTLGGGGHTHIRTIEELTTALAALPGARAAAAAQQLPLRGGGYNMPVRLEGRPELSGASTEYRMVTPGYIEVMGMELQDGRAISAADHADSEPVVVINEAFAETYFPGVSPIGRRVGDEVGGRFTRVIGVVADAAERDLTDGAQPVRYVAAAQLSWVDAAQTLVLETMPGADAATLLDAARATVQRIAPGVAVREATTMSRVLDAAVGPARQVLSLLAILTALALVLGAVGVYGVIAHFAARRRRDWAIRCALGMTGPRIAAHVVGHGVLLAGAGVALGLAAAAGLARLLGSFLYGVSPIDAVAFAAAGAALLGVGVIAASGPAVRAATVDPAIALREQ